LDTHHKDEPQADRRTRAGAPVGTQIDRADGLAPRPDGPRSERTALVARMVRARRFVKLTREICL
jgi:hypothetical protein